VTARSRDLDPLTISRSAARRQGAFAQLHEPGDDLLFLPQYERRFAGGLPGLAELQGQLRPLVHQLELFVIEPLELRLQGRQAGRAGGGGSFHPRGPFWFESLHGDKSRDGEYCFVNIPYRTMFRFSFPWARTASWATRHFISCLVPCVVARHNLFANKDIGRDWMKLLRWRYNLLRLLQAARNDTSPTRKRGLQPGPSLALRA
jgi:hypothetical protein